MRYKKALKMERCIRTDVRGYLKQSPFRLFVACHRQMTRTFVRIVSHIGPVVSNCEIYTRLFL